MESGVIPVYDAEEEEAALAIMGVCADTGMTPDAVFCREYLKTGDAMIACVRSGLVNSEYALSVQASAQLSRPEIQAALGVLRANGLRRERVIVTRDLIIEELQSAHEKAMETGQVSSAVSAKKLQAQLLGYLDQTVNVNHVVSARDLPLAQLRALVSGRLEQTGVIDGDYVEVEDAGADGAGSGAGAGGEGGDGAADAGADA
jgi:hypothetical protein